MQIPSTPDQECYAIILAAGASGRMGRPKTDLPWLDGKPLLQWMIDALAEAGWTPRVVLSPAAAIVWEDKLTPGSVAVNLHPELGKITSLVTGVQSVPASARWLLVCAVDQPRPPTLYRRLREETKDAKNRILVPDHLGHRGHPIVLAGTLRDELLKVSEHSLGLRGFLDAHLAETFRLSGYDPAWLPWDLNTFPEYERAFIYFSALPVEAK